jgi:hypothetical protein
MACTRISCRSGNKSRRLHSPSPHPHTRTHSAAAADATAPGSVQNSNFAGALSGLASRSRNRPRLPAPRLWKPEVPSRPVNLCGRTRVSFLYGRPTARIILIVTLETAIATEANIPWLSIHCADLGLQPYFGHR